MRRAVLRPVKAFWTTARSLARSRGLPWGRAASSPLVAELRQTRLDIANQPRERLDGCVVPGLVRSNHRANLALVLRAEFVTGQPTRSLKLFGETLDIALGSDALGLEALKGGTDFFETLQMTRGGARRRVRHAVPQKSGFSLEPT